MNYQPPLLICLCLSLILVSDEGIENAVNVKIKRVVRAATKLTDFVRGKSVCTFSIYRKDSYNTYNMGTQYSSSNTQVGLCCKDNNKKNVASMKSMKVDLKQRNANCCINKGTICYINGVRPCSEYICFSRFNNSGSKVIQNTANDSMFNPYLCPDPQPPPESKTFIRIYPLEERLISYYDSQHRCKDKKRKYLIAFNYLDFYTSRYKIEPSRFKWCCSKNIFKDYSINPKDVCCGLSGSSAPNFYPGALVNVDNPPCCRTLGGRSLCEPRVANITDGNQVCPPLSGTIDTKNLTEDLPLFSPQYFPFFINRNEPSGRGYEAPSLKIFKWGSSHRKYLYLFSDFYNDQINPDNDLDDHAIYSIGCNVRLESSANDFLKQCCISITVFALVNNKALKFPKKFMKFSCAKSNITDGKFMYTSCIKDNCVKTSDDQRYLGAFTMNPANKNTFYGSQKYFEARYKYFT